MEIPRLFSSKGEVALYDLTIDRAEKNNLAAQHPDIVKNLSAKLEAWLTTLPKDDVKTADEDEQRPLGFGEWVGGASSTKREHAG